jgi:PadR family transcriptional regulator
MGPQYLDLPQGTLDLLILKLLQRERQHGWAIAERLHALSGETVRIKQGSLYPALHRLERKGWIKAHWSTSDHNRRAKYYELTKAGREQLGAETRAWHRLSSAVGQILESA